MDKKRLMAAIDDGRTNSYGTDEQSDLGQKRAQAIEAYLGLNTDPAPEGRSQVIDRSVYETVSVILPSLTRIFAGSSDDVCKFIPIGADDEMAAEQTTAVIANVVTQQNQWEQVVTDWIHDASLLINGYCMAYWDESDQSIQETYEGQSEDQMIAILSDPKVKLVQHSESPDEEGTALAQEQYQMAMQQMQPGMPQPPPPGPVMKHDIVIERAENEGKVCIEVLPPEHCYVHVNTPDWTLKNCPYFEYRCQKTIAQLKGMGLDVPLDISDNESDDSEEDDARNRFGEDRDNLEGGKGLMREVWARMIWVRADAGDGEDRLYYVIAVGKTILFAEKTNRIHVASMTPQPLPHRHIGMSIAETVVDIQMIKTAVKRGGLDNLYLLNNGRHFISDKVNLSDFLDARPGGVVRLFDGALPGDGHVMPLVHPIAFDQIIGSLEYFDQERQNRTGASRYFSGTDANAINKTASGTIALQNMASMRVEHYARMMAPAVEELFSIVHEIVSKHQNKPQTIKLRGEWVTVDPQAWLKKRDVKIAVGVGAGNKDSMIMQLQGMLGAQMEVGLPLGLVTRENIHATNSEIAKLNGFANVEKFWPDPRKLPPPEPQKSPEQIKAEADMQKEQFKAQNDAQRFQAEQQAKQQEFQMQLMMDSQREEMQARQKTLEQEMKARFDATIEQMKAEASERQFSMQLAFDKWAKEFDASLQLALAGQQADTAIATEKEKKSPDNRIDEVIAAVQQFQQEAMMPAELVRDANGRAMAVKKGDKVRNIVRGPDGKAIGLQ